MDTPGDDDPLRAMTVERVTCPDGRYLLYFSWPVTDEQPVGTEPREGEPDDV